MAVLYAFTAFLSAALLFVVQPMVARMLLPHFGGSAAVWTTSMLFFQIALLAGYGYAHALARRLRVSRQLPVHLGLIAISGLTLPIAIAVDPTAAARAPVPTLLWALSLGVGPAFFVASTSAPLLQHWYAHTGRPDAHDPYHLYAASNAGSMIALLGYPVLVEPALPLAAQATGWAWGYALFGALVLGCGLVARRGRIRVASTQAEAGADADAPSWRQRARWLLLAFIPSSLMLGVTQYLTTDIASVPLLWVLPLAIYLGSFILVFARRPRRLPSRLVHLLAPAAVVVLGLGLVDAPMWSVVGAHLALFGLMAFYFHGRLADLRPSASHLTEFYLVMSVGGAAGGLFNGLVAPLLLDRAVEYLAVLVLAVVLMPVDRARHADPYRNPWLVPLAFAPLGLAYLWASGFLDLTRAWTFALSFAVIGAAVGLAVWRPRLEHVMVAAVMVLGIADVLHTPGIVAYDRSFFGAYKVYDRQVGGRSYRSFSHGTTSHGTQGLDEDLATTPLAYHHPAGPVGQVLARVPHERVGVVGLGAGAMAAYGEAGERWDFFEIDPLVEEIAREHFDFLSGCGEVCHTFVGDGRMLLAQMPDGAYDLLFLDAYNSDSVPTHLLTREALQLYLDKLSPRGVLVFHVSNRYLDVESVVGALAEDAGLHARVQVHRPGPLLRHIRVRTSAYAVVAREAEQLGMLEGDPRWRMPRVAEVVWTDDFIDLVRVIDWD